MTEWRANAVLTILPGQIDIKIPLMLRLRFPGQIRIRFPFPRRLTPAVVLFVAFLDLTFPVTGTSAYSSFFSLPVGEAQMDRELAVTHTLNLKPFVTDPYIKMVPLISAVLLHCPLFAPDANVFSIVMFPVFLLAKPIRPNRPGRDNDMYMRIFFDGSSRLSPLWMAAIAHRP